MKTITVLEVKVFNYNRLFDVEVENISKLENFLLDTVDSGNQNELIANLIEEELTQLLDDNVTLAGYKGNDTIAYEDKTNVNSYKSITFNYEIVSDQIVKVSFN